MENRLAVRLCQGHTPQLARKNAHPVPRENGDGSVSIDYTYALATVPAAQCSLRYTVYPCGTVRVALSYDPVSGLGDMPEFGVMMKLNADYHRVRYYGLGPEENYSDRCRGARLGIFETTAQDNLAVISYRRSAARAPACAGRKSWTIAAGACASRRTGI